MGFPLLLLESLAAAICVLALAIAWAARGHWLRWLWPAVVFALFAAPTGMIVLQYLDLPEGRLIRTPWFTYTLSWLAAFAACGLTLAGFGVRRPGPGLSRNASGWSRRRLWLGLAGSFLALAFTFWNLDLAARADLAIARQEAGDLLLAMTPPPAAESENAAPTYIEVCSRLADAFDKQVEEATRHGIDSLESVDWRSPAIRQSLMKHENDLARLRAVATLKGCTIHYQRGLLDAAMPAGTEIKNLARAVTLLAVDARAKAAEGNLNRALENITAILRIFRHLSDYPDLAWGRESIAWRTLEDVLRLSPKNQASLPAFEPGELFPLVRKVREEQALLGMIFPAAASQPSLALQHEKQKLNSAEIFVIESVVAPAARVMVIPDEIPAMRKLFDDYHRSPRSARDETPRDWASLRDDVDNDPTSVFGLHFIKPKQRKLLAVGSQLAALRESARTGYAVARYQRKHGQYPDRLEQLVPEFMAKTPVDPRDGQPLRIQRVAEFIVIYAPLESAIVQSGKVTKQDLWNTPPIFRLHANDR